MKISFELDAEFREDQGKGASRRLRHLGKVPAILYGGKRDARALVVDHTKLSQLMDDERFFSTILALKVGSQQQAAVLKDVQRHPYRNQIVHADFQRVLEDEKIRMQVPLHFKGGAESKGVKEQGGVLGHVRNDVEVTCLPKDLPEFVEVDVSGLEINQVIKLSGLKLPAGVELVDLLAGRDGPVASIHMPRVEEEEAPPVDEAAAAAAAAGTPGAAPAAGAPGAPGAAPAAGAAPGAPGAAPAAGAAGAPAAKGGKDAKDAKKGDGKK
ncbi:MAG TPA: 50S ribosomal protein L25/general stress protein Ctc [Steroidobacteraceae bacterium]|jgi:large subunit ribosomal protein L25|nr:50S ribosomal protein L25/general stress protein Ctc [Steroidobacteraceae bacterium]